MTTPPGQQSSGDAVTIVRDQYQKDEYERPSDSLVDLKVRNLTATTSSSPIAVKHSINRQQPEVARPTNNYHDQKCWQDVQTVPSLINPAQSHQWSPIQQYRADDLNRNLLFGSPFANQMATRSNPLDASCGGFRASTQVQLIPTATTTTATMGHQSLVWQQQVDSQLAAYSQLEATLHLMLRDSQLRKHHHDQYSFVSSPLMSSSSFPSPTSPNCLLAANQCPSSINTSNEYALAIGNYANSLQQSNLANTTKQLPLASIQSTVAIPAQAISDTLATSTRPSDDETITNIANRKQSTAAPSVDEANRYTLAGQVSLDESAGGMRTMIGTRVSSQQQKAPTIKFVRSSFSVAHGSTATVVAAPAAVAATATTTTAATVRAIDVSRKPEVIDWKPRTSRERHNNRVFEIHHQHNTNNRTNKSNSNEIGQNDIINTKEQHRLPRQINEGAINSKVVALECETFKELVFDCEIDEAERPSAGPTDREEVEVETGDEDETATKTDPCVERSSLIANNYADEKRRKNERDIDHRTSTTALTTSEASSSPSLKATRRSAKPLDIPEIFNDNGANKSDILNNQNNGRVRTAYSSIQILNLEREFTKSMYLSRIRRIELAQKLALSEKQVKIWFQNRRVKYKKENYRT